MRVTVNCHPKFLNRDFRDKIFRNLKERYELKAFPRIGFINRLDSINIIDNYIESSTSKIKLIVDLNADIKKPRVGDSVIGKIVKIVNDIVVVKCEYYSVIISSENKCSCDIVKRPGNEIKLTLTLIDYRKFKIICFGKHDCNSDDGNDGTKTS